MDLDEWELLPNDDHHHHTFLDFHENGNKKMFNNQTNIFKNYFIVESPLDESTSIHPMVKKGSIQLVPVPIQISPLPSEQLEKVALSVEMTGPDVLALPVSFTKENEFVDLKMDLPKSGNTQRECLDSGKMKENSETVLEHDLDTVSQVSFKKMKENEFVDMKMDSPKSSNRGIFQGECLDSGKMKEISEKKMDLDANLEEHGGGLNLWKWGFNGIGALCSVGVAAATICILVFGSNQKNKQHQKLRFQIYTDDKRIKKVVHHAHKLNEAISAVRGVPLNRAHITFGGYYDALES